MIFIITYCLLSIIVAMFAIYRRIGVLKVLLISLFFTPFTGIFFIMRSERNIIYHHYTASKYCNACQKKLNSTHLVCPQCGTELDAFWDMGLEV